MLLLAALGWLLFGQMDFDDPVVRLKTPVEVVGAKTPLTLEAGDEGSGLKEVKITFSQDGQEKVVLDKKFPPGGDPGETVEIPFTLEPKALGFKEGKATLTARVWDRSWRDMFRGRTNTLSQEVVIDLVPITVAFQSVSHLLHAGGTGVIGYRLNKPAGESGVLIGGQFFRGYANPRGGQGEYVVLFPVPQEGPAVIQVELVARPARPGGEAGSFPEGEAPEMAARQAQSPGCFLAQGRRPPSRGPTAATSWEITWRPTGKRRRRTVKVPSSLLPELARAPLVRGLPAVPRANPWHVSATAGPISTK